MAGLGSNRSPSTGRRLQRNLRRRWLGGVCAGLADFLGVEPAWVRLAALVSVFFSFSLTVWVYLALWIVIPARPETPMPDVSWSLRLELYRIARLVRRAHRRLPAPIADQVQDAFDALKVLAGQLESTTVSSGTVTTTWEEAHERLPRLVQQLLIMPARTHAVEELEDLRRTLRRASHDALGQEIEGRSQEPETTSGDLAAWREEIAPRCTRLHESARPQTLAILRRIENKLAFLLADMDETGGQFDLRPFEVRKIAFEYLPDALDQYLKLPPSMAQSLPLSGGVTAEESLTEQLIRLDHALEELATSVFERDAQGLLVHGRFLREKFADQPFRLPEEDQR